MAQVAKSIETALSQISDHSHLKIYQDSCSVSPTIHDTPDGLMMSAYIGDRTKRGIATTISRIKKAFPAWSNEQTEILQDRFAENGFTDKRMIDSVNHVIDTYEGFGRIPNVANFIQFDRKVRLYTVTEVTKLSNEGLLSWDDVAIARIEGRSGCRSAATKPVLFVKRTDAERFGIVTREPKQHGQDWPD